MAPGARNALPDTQPQWIARVTDPDLHRLHRRTGRVQAALVGKCSSALFCYRRHPDNHLSLQPKYPFVQAMSPAHSRWQMRRLRSRISRLHFHFDGLAVKLRSSFSRSDWPFLMLIRGRHQQLELPYCDVCINHEIRVPCVVNFDIIRDRNPCTWRALAALALEWLSQ